MIPSETIRAMLDTAVQAPSGENAQPWRFEVTNETVSLFNVPDRDRSLYNFEQRASYISHGAVIENIAIAAGHSGLDASVVLFPENGDPDLIARISFVPSSARADQGLYQYIPRRTTNRKKYDGRKIPDATLKALSDAGSGVSGISVWLAAERPAIEALASAASVNDIILLENRPVHDFFFSHVHWRLEEEQDLRSGFYIEVLELAPPVKTMFKLFRHWPIMKIFNGLGAAKKGAKENTKIYASASAFGAIALADERPQTFVEAGRVFQRIWLTATANGISLQPLTGVLFFRQQMHGGKSDAFSAPHRAMIEDSYQKIISTFGINQEIVTMMFRLGYADPPTASSLKKLPDVEFS